MRTQRRVFIKRPPAPEYTTHICRTCRFRQTQPGTVHISCRKAFDADANPLAAVLAILGGVGRTPLPGPTSAVNFQPIVYGWPGCGAWPANFDENIIRDCDGYELKEAMA